MVSDRFSGHFQGLGQARNGGRDLPSADGFAPKRGRVPVGSQEKQVEQRDAVAPVGEVFGL
jgi:hypothetical protein